MSSKLLKSELKQIVKECLIEILQEGISTDAEQYNMSKINEQRAIGPAPKRTSFDHVSWASNREESVIEKPDYMEQAKNLTDNSILAEVLADSHRTMVGQIEAEKMGKTVMAGDIADRQAASSDPINLFGESADNWAALAFGEK